MASNTASNMGRALINFPAKARRGDVIEIRQIFEVEDFAIRI